MDAVTKARCGVGSFDRANLYRQGASKREAGWAYVALTSFRAAKPGARSALRMALQSKAQGRSIWSSPELTTLSSSTTTPASTTNIDKLAPASMAVLSHKVS